MKQKLKTISKVLTLFLLIAFCSCEKDFDQETLPTQHGEQFIIKDYSLKSANKIPKFFNANSKTQDKIRRFKSKNNTNSKVEITDFNIDPTTVREISVGDKTTYTMLITNDNNQTTSGFQNLVIEVDGANNTNAYLLEYTPSQEAQYIPEHDSYALKGNITTTPIGDLYGTPWDPGDGGDGGDGGLTGVDCVDLLYCFKVLPAHIAGTRCKTVEPVSIFPVRVCGSVGPSSGGIGCDGTGNSNGPTNTNNGSSSNNGSSGSNSENTTSTTTPVVSLVPPEPKPCEIMAKKSGSLVFKNKVAYLNQPNILSQDHEEGFAETRDTSGNISYTSVSANSQTHALNFPASLKMTGFVHDHQNDYSVNGNIKVTIKNFSPLDLFTFATHVQADATSLGIPPSETYGVVITSEGSFALKLLGTNIGSIISNAEWMIFQDEYAIQAQDLQTEGNLNSENVQKMLLNFMKKYGLYEKVGLFEKEVDNSWSRKTLNNNGDLVKTPCTN